MIQIIERFATQSPCWKTNVYQQSIGPEHPDADARYQQYYSSRHKLALHSLGCARASADYQSDKWNNPNNNSAIAHAVVDSNDGIARQNLRWDMRGWHCGTPGNNFMIGVEMGESDAIHYKGSTDKFEVLDMEKARRHCTTAYNGAVALFAELCLMFALDPAEDILSHKEAAAKGLAGAHTDPEHYWVGLGMAYTMDGFRAAVKRQMDAQNQGSGGKLYRIQVGAFHNSDYARAFLEEVQRHYPKAFMKTVDESE